MIITVLSVILFFSFGLIFRSVYEQNINTFVRQNGNNIGSLIKGALYQSMMENDEKTIQNTLDIINTMPGVKDVNLYDSKDNLAYSSFGPEAEGHIDPNCKNCHEDFGSMFPAKEKAYKIIDADVSFSLPATRLVQQDLQNLTQFRLGLGITFIVAGLMSMAFMVFSGIQL